MTNKDIKLRPCPICGSQIIKIYTTEGKMSFRRGTVRCLKCGCTVKAEGGGHELFRELGIIPGNDGRFSMADYEVVRKESNARAYKNAANKWNGDYGEVVKK